MPNPILNAQQVRAARRRAWLGDTISEIACGLDVRWDVASMAVRGETWGYITDPPPVPRDYKPIIYRVCANELCGALYKTPLNGGLCQACFSHFRDYGDMRFSKVRRPGPEALDLGGIEELYARYLCGETMQELADELGCTRNTISNHFRRHGFKRLPPRTQQLTSAIVAQARTMYYEDGARIIDIADHFEQNYLTIFDAVHWRTWRTAGGPLPPPDDDEDEKHPCENCGVLTTKRLCRYCRAEAQRNGEYSDARL